MKPTSGYKVSIELWCPIDLNDPIAVARIAAYIRDVRDGLTDNECDLVTFETKYVHRRNRQHPERDGQLDIPEPPRVAALTAMLGAVGEIVDVKGEKL